MWSVANSTVAFVLGSFAFFSQVPEESIVAVTPFGSVEGVSDRSRDGRRVYEFLHLPFALPPVGHLRFKDPLPWTQTWEGVLDGTVLHPRCIQYHVLGKMLMGEEDCLYLSVYTHRYQRVEEGPIAAESLKPVIVYLHGGLFMQGNAVLYQPMYLLDEDVVFVCPNYRVAALGFLNMENDDVPGNMGLKDQVVALEWVQKYIQHFGGDPNRVTLMGESAGAIAVHLHMLSPMSQGLFHRAISQSGTVLMTPWGIRNNALEQANHFVSKLGCSPSNNASQESIINCLQELDVTEICYAHIGASSYLHHEYDLFGPSVETRETTDSVKFLPDLPHRLIKSGNYSKVPWIVGANDFEGFLYAAHMVMNATVREQLNTNWTYWIPLLARFNDDPDKAEMSARIREHYFGNASAEINMATLPQLVSFMTDRFFLEGLHHTWALHKAQGQRIYPYIYTYRRKNRMLQIFFGLNYKVPLLLDVLLSAGKTVLRSAFFGPEEEIDYGAIHGAELALLFNWPGGAVTEKSPDFAFSKLLVKTWTHFATFGTPPKDVNGTEWESLSDEDGVELSSSSILRLDRTIEKVASPFEENAKFWASLRMSPEKYYYIENSNSQ